MPTYNSRVCNLNSGSYNRVYNSLNLLILASLLGLFLLHVLLQCLHKLLHVLLQCLVNCSPVFIFLSETTFYPYHGWVYQVRAHGWDPYQLLYCSKSHLVCCSSYRGGSTRIPLPPARSAHILGRGLLLGLVISLARPKGPSSYHHTLRDYC